ncbi:hypothetical protein Taro_027771, partial [Colocasia esculenta]|nr:hypothetical protein [Colocasia esculenta]
GLVLQTSLCDVPFGCEGRPGGIQGVVPFWCEGSPGGIQGVVPFGCEGRPAELGVVVFLRGIVPLFSEILRYCSGTRPVKGEASSGVVGRHWRRLSVTASGLEKTPDDSLCTGEGGSRWRRQQFRAVAGGIDNGLGQATARARWFRASNGSGRRRETFDDGRGRTLRPTPPPYPIPPRCWWPQQTPSSAGACGGPLTLARLSLPPRPVFSGVGLTHCDVGSEQGGNKAVTALSKASSVSAIEQLKTSTGDRKFPSSIPHLYVHLLPMNLLLKKCLIILRARKHRDESKRDLHRVGLIVFLCTLLRFSSIAFDVFMQNE